MEIKEKKERNRKINLQQKKEDKLIKLPYTKTEVCIPRIASILGTCNESTFLNDDFFCKIKIKPFYYEI